MSTVPAIETGSLRKAVLRSWIAQILALALYCVTYGLLNLAAPATQYYPAGRGVAGLPQIAVGLLTLIPMAAILFLPGTGLLWGMLLLAERWSSRLRSLPLWLAAGAVTTAPIAWFFWYIDTVFEGLENPDPQPPYAWVNLEFPLFLLLCGPIGALIAWRYREAALAR